MKIDFNGMTQKGLMALRKHSPEILMFLGIGGMATGGIMACKATHDHFDNIVTDHRVQVVKIRNSKIEESDERKELTKAYLKTAGRITALYAPSVAISALSAASILTGNNILRKRNIALAAAYAAIDRGFKDYRGRVVDRFGADVDHELRNDLHQEKIDETVTDEDGKKKKVKKSVVVVGDGGLSDYSRYFAYGDAKGAEHNADYNLFFLRSQQDLANHILRANGFLFLNEVYDMLGIERSIPGQTVGWVYDKNKDDHGDNYVDFGIQEVYRKRSDNPNDYEKVFLLDFNVDGSILDHSLDKGLMTR